MKKKGLIIATIVMVLVLAVSLTTATYAWFTAASTTKVDAFTFSVANNNDVNIGLKADNIYSSEGTSASYVSGTVTYNAGTAGVTEGVTSRASAWAGTVNGLSNTVDHDINWGAQGKAVGFSTTATANTQTVSTLHSFGTATTNNGYVYSASGVAQTSVTDVEAAVCNGSVSGDTKADYVYLPLGVQPNKTLWKNELIIYVDAYESSSSICGMLAALHVAYRINGAAAITDVQPFGSGASNTANQSAHYDTSLSTMSANLGSTVPTDAPTGTTATQQSAFTSTFTSATYHATKSGAIVIDLTAVADTTDDIAQVDMWFYLDGSDSDCQQGAVVNVVGNMYIFFYTIAAA